MDILKLQDYTIYSGDWTVPLRSLLDAKGYTKIIVLVDENTRRYCLPILKNRLQNIAFEIIEIPSGEVHKNIQTCQKIWSEMMAHQVDRKALMINLGGGVIGDMGGFCAATFKRGIDFIQIPTTLLSQVDASIGGKLGIDFQQVKNSIGLFQNPQAVLIDAGFLKTLSFEELRSGYAEVLKHSLIANATQWQSLIQIAALNNIAQIEKELLSSLKIKQQIVEEDPFEKGIRKALNYGHTIGHAVEAYSFDTERPLLHGEAIAIGIICESYLSHKILGLSSSELEQISNYIVKIYKKLSYKLTPLNAQLLGYMLNDKKNERQQINFSLIPRIGKCQINQTCTYELIIESLKYYDDL